MAYKLKADEALSAGIRRIAAEELGAAVAGLQAGLGEPGTVHDARKRFKKTRALLRLVRSELGETTYRRANGYLRDAGRDLSSLRDAQVLSETLAALAARFPNEAHQEVFGRTHLALQAKLRRGAADGGVAEAVAAKVAALEAQVPGWRVGDGWGAVAPNLARTYRRGRAAFRHAYRHPSDESLHEWRKRVKDLWYHLRVLDPLWPEVMTELAAQAGGLADLLGAEHDLAVLAQTLVAEPSAFGGAQGVRRILELSQKRREALRAEAWLLGRRLYAEGPKPFEKRLGAYWRAWQGRPESFDADL